MYNFRKKGLFLGGQNVISWGVTRGDWGGAFAPPPSLYVKKGPAVRTIHKILSSIKQVKVDRGIPMLCIRTIVHYINIYSRIVIQLNMYVKIITSSGFKSTILTDFVQGQLRVPFRFGRCLKFPGSTLIYRKLSSPPQALRLRARLDTKWKKKIGAEFMTSVSYRPEVITPTFTRVQIQSNLGTTASRSTYSKVSMSKLSCDVYT